MSFKKLFLTAALLSLILGGCKEQEVPELPPPSYNPQPEVSVDPSAEDEVPDDGGGEEGTVPQPTPSGEWEANRGKVVTPSGTGWTSKTIREGITYYTFSGKDDVTGQEEQVFVIDLDLSNDAYEVKLNYSSKAIPTSDAHIAYDAIATINAGYEAGSIFIRTDSRLRSMLPNKLIGNTTVPNWKSEAAFFGDRGRNLVIEFSGKNMTVNQQRNYYLTKSAEKDEETKEYLYPDMLSSAPMLIDDYNPVGESFCDYSIPSSNINKLDSEDPQRHQRVRHPRTAIALTENGHFIMFAVDGRYSVSRGMSCRELTRFLVKHFNPQYALNLDGGGSTTMCVEGEGDNTTNVVNYPCDNNENGKVHDHAGERARDTQILIVEKKEPETQTEG